MTLSELRNYYMSRAWQAYYMEVALHQHLIGNETKSWEALIKWGMYMVQADHILATADGLDPGFYQARGNF